MNKYLTPFIFETRDVPTLVAAVCIFMVEKGEKESCKRIIQQMCYSLEITPEEFAKLVMPELADGNQSSD